MNTSIDDMITRIEKHKGVFLPNKQKYLDWVFRYACRKLEYYNISPSSNSSLLHEEIYKLIHNTAKLVVHEYWRDTRINYIYTPSINTINICLQSDILYNENRSNT